MDFLERQKIKAKIAKLITLANEKTNPFAHERARARELAEQIAKKHGIPITEFEQFAEATANHTADAFNKSYAKWKAGQEEKARQKAEKAREARAKAKAKKEQAKKETPLFEYKVSADYPYGEEVWEELTDKKYVNFGSAMNFRKKLQDLHPTGFFFVMEFIRGKQKWYTHKWDFQGALVPRGKNNKNLVFRCSKCGVWETGQDLELDKTLDCPASDYAYY